jgi:hypothetical protein
MSNPAPAAPAATPPASTSVPPTGTGNEPDAVTKLTETVSKLAEQVQGQSKIIAALQKPKPAETQPPAPATPDPLTDRVKELESHKAKLVERDTRQREREALQTLEKALVAGGVDPKQAPRFAKLALVEHKDKIIVDDDFNVGFKEADDKTTPLTTWVNAFLQTEDGKVFLPPVQNPSVKTGNVTAHSGKTKLTKAQIAAGEFDPKRLRAGEYEIV